MNVHVISYETAKKIKAVLDAYKEDAEEEGIAAHADDLSSIFAAIDAGKVTDTLASVAIEEIAGGDAAYCIWVEEELNGCPHDAVTDIAKVAGDRVIDDFVTDEEDD